MFRKSARLFLATSLFALAAAASRASETTTYSYDALGRLTATSSSGTVNNGVATSVGYDPAGNRSSYSVTGAGGGSGGSGGTGGTGGGGGGSGDPPAAVFSVGDSSIAEGGSLVFTVSKSGGSGGTSSVGYATADGSAAAADYQSTSGTLTFAAAETSKTVTVATADDSLDENAETLSLNLSGASAGSSIADGQGIGTIADNDDPPPPPPPPSNNPPTLTNKNGSQAKCMVKVHTVLTSADTDIDNDTPLSLVSVNGNGFVLFDSTSIEFTSTASAGTKVATYVVQDSRGATASATLTVNVSGGFCQTSALPNSPLAGPGAGS